MKPDYEAAIRALAAMVKGPEESGLPEWGREFYLDNGSYQGIFVFSEKHDPEIFKALLAVYEEVAIPSATP